MPEYARNGFTELVLVSGLNFLILVIVLQYTQVRGKGGVIVQQVLLLILVCCSAVMLGSAFVRLNLYEQAYGYTYIRFLVHAFMIFLGFFNHCCVADSIHEITSDSLLHYPWTVCIYAN